MVEGFWPFLVDTMIMYERYATKEVRTWSHKNHSALVPPEKIRGWCF